MQIMTPIFFLISDVAYLLFFKWGTPVSMITYIFLCSFPYTFCLKNKTQFLPQSLLRAPIKTQNSI